MRAAIGRGQRGKSHAKLRMHLRNLLLSVISIEQIPYAIALIYHENIGKAIKTDFKSFLLRVTLLTVPILFVIFLPLATLKFIFDGICFKPFHNSHTFNLLLLNYRPLLLLMRVRQNNDVVNAHYIQPDRFITSNVEGMFNAIA